MRLYETVKQKVRAMWIYESADPVHFASWSARLRCFFAPSVFSYVVATVMFHTVDGLAAFAVKAWLENSLSDPKPLFTINPPLGVAFLVATCIMFYSVTTVSTSRLLFCPYIYRRALFYSLLYLGCLWLAYHRFFSSDNTEKWIFFALLCFVNAKLSHAAAMIVPESRKVANRLVCDIQKYFYTQPDKSGMCHPQFSEHIWLSTNACGGIEEQVKKQMCEDIQFINTKMKTQGLTTVQLDQWRSESDPIKPKLSGIDHNVAKIKAIRRALHVA